MVYDKANELAKLLKESDEFREYKTTKEKAFENDTTASLIKEYHKLQLAAQAAMVSGKKDDETMQRLQKIGELLQLNQDASAFLFAEYITSHHHSRGPRFPSPAYPACFVYFE